MHNAQSTFPKQMSNVRGGIRHRLYEAIWYLRFWSWQCTTNKASRFLMGSSLPSFALWHPDMSKLHSYSNNLFRRYPGKQNYQNFAIPSYHPLLFKSNHPILPSPELRHPMRNAVRRPEPAGARIAYHGNDLRARSLWGQKIRITLCWFGCFWNCLNMFLYMQ